MRVLFLALFLTGSLLALEPDRCFEAARGERIAFRIHNSEQDIYELSTTYAGRDYTVPMQLLQRARSIEENEDIFETLHDPKVEVVFHGKRSESFDLTSETGTITIGAGEPFEYVRVKCPKFSTHKHF